MARSDLRIRYAPVANEPGKRAASVTVGENDTLMVLLAPGANVTIHYLDDNGQVRPANIIERQKIVLQSAALEGALASKALG